MNARYAIFERDATGQWIEVEAGDRLPKQKEDIGVWDLSAPAFRCWREGRNGKWGSKPGNVERV